METVDAYVLKYVSKGFIPGSGFGPDKFWTAQKKAIYFPKNEQEHAVLIARADELCTGEIISGPLSLMYTAFYGVPAETAWTGLLGKLELDENHESISKEEVPLEILEWAKSLWHADNPSGIIRDFFIKINKE